jgi:hypothetical protein
MKKILFLDDETARPTQLFSNCLGFKHNLDRI